MMKNEQKQSAVGNQPSAFRNEFLSLRKLIHKARLNSSLMGLANEAAVELDIVEQAAIQLADSLEELARLQRVAAAAWEVVKSTNVRQWIENIEKLAAALSEMEPK